MTDATDRINRLEMSKASSVRYYSQSEELSKAEQAALDRVARAARGRSILDIGVGAGRTVRALLRVSPDYVGVDSSREMIAACRRRFPGVRFQHTDARDMPDIPDGSVHLAMFSCNGIGMVTHEVRMSILREVLRVLEPGGVFLFSSHNKNSPEEASRLKLPPFAMTLNPMRLLIRIARFSGYALKRMHRRSRFRKLEVRTPEYSVINDVCHHYGVMLCYVTLAHQRRQLESVGFAKDAEAYDLEGNRILGDSRDNSIMFLARKPA